MKVIQKQSNSEPKPMVIGEDAKQREDTQKSEADNQLQEPEAIRQPDEHFHPSLTDREQTQKDKAGQEQSDADQQIHNQRDAADANAAAAAESSRASDVLERWKHLLDDILEKEKSKTRNYQELESVEFQDLEASLLDPDHFQFNGLLQSAPCQWTDYIDWCYYIDLDQMQFIVEEWNSGLLGLGPTVRMKKAFLLDKIPPDWLDQYHTAEFLNWPLHAKLKVVYWRYILHMDDDEVKQLYGMRPDQVAVILEDTKLFIGRMFQREIERDEREEETKMKAKIKSINYWDQ